MVDCSAIATFTDVIYNHPVNVFVLTFAVVRWNVWGMITAYLSKLSRHLPMIGALLHGRVHLNFQEFRSQNHLTFFSNVLAILELLQPLVFHSEHQRALQDCLLSFMKILQVRE